MPRRSRVFALVTMLLGATACSSSGGSGSTQSGIAAAMASVSGSGPAAAYFEYGNLAALRKLGVIHPDAAAAGSGKIYNQRWGRVAGVGDSTVINFSALTPKLIGVNLLAGDTAVTIGQPPDVATRIDAPMDAKSISAKLTSLGAKRHSFAGTAGLSFGPDNQVNHHTKLWTQNYAALSIYLNEMTVDDHGFAFSPNQATLLRVRDPGSRSLLDTAHFSAMADCLGDVLAAVVTTPHAGSGTSTDTHAQLVGVGVRAPNAATGPVDEVLCVLPAAGQQPVVHRSLAQHLAPRATDPISDQPISNYVSKTAVRDIGGLVRALLTLNPRTTVGYLITGLYQNAIPYWDGSCASTDLQSRQC